MGWTSWFVPCSVEGWIFLILEIGILFYLGSNFESGTINIVGFIVTILIGMSVVGLKSK